MVHIHTEGVVAASQQFAFDYLSDFRNAPDWLFGVNKLTVVGEVTSGLGTVYDGSMALGPKTLHSVVKVARWEPPILFEHEYVSGFAVNSTWQVNSVDSAKSEVVVDIDYNVPGGIGGRVLGRLLGPLLSMAVERSRDTLRDRIEAAYQAVRST